MTNENWSKGEYEYGLNLMNDIMQKREEVNRLMDGIESFVSTIDPDYCYDTYKHLSENDDGTQFDFLSLMESISNKVKRSKVNIPFDIADDDAKVIENNTYIISQAIETMKLRTKNLYPELKDDVGEISKTFDEFLKEPKIRILTGK